MTKLASVLDSLVLSLVCQKYQTRSFVLWQQYRKERAVRVRDSEPVFIRQVKRLAYSRYVLFWHRTYSPLRMYSTRMRVYKPGTKKTMQKSPGQTPGQTRTPAGTVFTLKWDLLGGVRGPWDVGMKDRGSTAHSHRFWHHSEYPGVLLPGYNVSSDLLNHRGRHHCRHQQCHN